MKERSELKANKRDVNNIVLKANTSISGFQGLFQSSSTGAGSMT